MAVMGLGIQEGVICSRGFPQNVREDGPYINGFSKVKINGPSSLFVAAGSPCRRGFFHHPCSDVVIARL